MGCTYAVNTTLTCMSKQMGASNMVFFIFVVFFFNQKWDRKCHSASKFCIHICQHIALICDQPNNNSALTGEKIFAAKYHRNIPALTSKLHLGWDEHRALCTWILCYDLYHWLHKKGQGISSKKWSQHRSSSPAVWLQYNLYLHTSPCVLMMKQPIFHFTFLI